jgi:hypothetical protein
MPDIVPGALVLEVAAANAVIQSSVRRQERQAAIFFNDFESTVLATQTVIPGVLELPPQSEVHLVFRGPEPESCRWYLSRVTAVGFAEVRQSAEWLLQHRTGQLLGIGRGAGTGEQGWLIEVLRRLASVAGTTAGYAEFHAQISGTAARWKVRGLHRYIDQTEKWLEILEKTVCRNGPTEPGFAEVSREITRRWNQILEDLEIYVGDHGVRTEGRGWRPQDAILGHLLYSIMRNHPREQICGAELKVSVAAEEERESGGVGEGSGTAGGKRFVLGPTGFRLDAED